MTFPTPVSDGRLRCCVCGYDLGSAEDPYRDPSCPRCLDRQALADAALDENVVDDHCEVCGEYESECTCLDEGARCATCGDAFTAHGVGRRSAIDSNICVYCATRDHDDSIGGAS